VCNYAGGINKNRMYDTTMIIRIRKSKKEIQWSKGEEKSEDSPKVISCRR